MMNIGNIKLAGRLLLAPMAGVTDAAFRHVCFGLGAALTCTEMVSARALCYGDKKTKDLLLALDRDRPVCAQIFGHEPEIIGEAAPMARELAGADILDINMGCPVGKIVKNGDGSALMRDPDLAGRIIEAAVKTAGCPVTVKFRKGWDKGNVNAVAFAQVCQQAGAAAVTVHGRTRAQMYEGAADWDIIRDVKRALDIPVIANGDVWDAGGCVRILRYTGCDGAMIGRGAFGNPWIFAQGNALLAGGEIPSLPPLRERLDLAEEQIRLSASLRGERPACLEARRHLAWYLRGVSHSSPFKQEIVHLESLTALHSLVGKMKKELR